MIQHDCYDCRHLCLKCGQLSGYEYSYRKPNPGMITQYIYDKHVSSRHCLMIGDASGLPGQFSDSDLQCAKNAHVKYQDVDDFVRQYYPQ